MSNENLSKNNDTDIFNVDSDDNDIDNNQCDVGDDENEGDDLPDYSDDDDYRKLMNEAIMKKLNDTPIVKEPKKSKNIINTTKPNKIKNTKNNGNIRLGEFFNSIESAKPAIFVSKRKLEKTNKLQNLTHVRKFNPKLPPYMVANMGKKSSNLMLDESNFPNL